MSRSKSDESGDPRILSHSSVVMMDMALFETGMYSLPGQTKPLLFLAGSRPKAAICREEVNPGFLL
jgi:hypothetical protein